MSLFTLFRQTSAKAYRQRKVPSGNKTDHVDAWSLADALRVDGHGWKALAKKILWWPSCACRDEVALIEERTALINQLQSALREYYPAAEVWARGHIADLGQIINPFGRLGLDMGGKPGSISVQMAPGDTIVGRTPNDVVRK